MKHKKRIHFFFFLFRCCCCYRRLTLPKRNHTWLKSHLQKQVFPDHTFHIPCQSPQSMPFFLLHNPYYSLNYTVHSHVCLIICLSQLDYKLPKGSACVLFISLQHVIDAQYTRWHLVATSTFLLNEQEKNQHCYIHIRTQQIFSYKTSLKLLLPQTSSSQK